MKKRVPKAFMQAISAHRNRLEKVLTAKATGTMKKLYDEAQGGLVKKLAKSIRSGEGGSFTAHQQRIVLAQLRQGQAVITQRMAKDFAPLSKQSQEAALHGLVDDVARLSTIYTDAELVLPVAEASIFAGVVEGRAPSLMRAQQTSMAKYGVRVVQSVEKELSLTMLRGESPSDAIDAVAEAIDGEWWQGERIVRTEISRAYGVTTAAGIEESAEEIPELMQRWSEYCDDSGAPIDQRVGVDSIAINGQVAKPGEPFFMPASAPFPDAKGRTKVPESLVGLSWETTPCRPNGRECLVAWMKDWGVPGWKYAGGSRVWLVK